MDTSTQSEKNDLKIGKIWNRILGTIAVINIIIILHHIFTRMNKKNSNYRLILLVTIYVFVCAIRSIWPRVDGTGLCIYDDYISTPFVGRCFTTIAEISFSVFIVSVTNVILDSLYYMKGVNVISKLNNSMVILITIAQIFCWIGIVSQDPSYNMIEESIWTIFASIILVIYLTLNSRISKLPSSPKLNKLKSIMPFILIGCVLYILFMILNDVPMYYKRSQELRKNNAPYKNLYDGIEDMKKCKKVTSSFKEWKEDIPWLTFYFTFSVWGAIIMLKWVEKYKKL
jgi:hypothetical protein